MITFPQFPYHTKISWKKYIGMSIKSLERIFEKNSQKQSNQMRLIVKTEDRKV